MGLNRLERTPCEVCGMTKEVGSYFVPENGTTWYYYDHNAPTDCIRLLVRRVEELELNARRKETYFR